MRGIVSTLLSLSLLVTVGTASAAVVTKDFQVKGWACEGCCGRTEKAIKEVHGVTAVRADYAKKLVTVTFDDAKANADKIRAAIEKAGFSCPLPKRKN